MILIALDKCLIISSTQASEKPIETCTFVIAESGFEYVF